MVWDFSLFCSLVHPWAPRMQFLFVSPRICRRLPSDSSSRRTPLPLANASHYQGAFGTFTLELPHMLGAHKKTADPQRGRLINAFILPNRRHCLTKRPR
jgi:hypothetical protein